MNSHIKIKVFPDQSNEEVIKNDDGSYDVYLREPAQRGMANRRLLTVLSESIFPKPKQIKIVSGHTSHSKIIEVGY